VPFTDRYCASNDVLARRQCPPNSSEKACQHGYMR
jgi:hypothetical protein